VASVKKTGEEKAEPKHIKVATIDTKTKKMRTLSEEEVNSYLSKVSGSKQG